MDAFRSWSITPLRWVMLTEEGSIFQPLVAVIGPTAVGKTTTALALARTLNGEIVSADSRLLYRGMDIGTAKPSPQELAAVPHHLIDVTVPDMPWTMARYLAEAETVIAGIHQRGRLPLLVGGTGQYVTAVLEGWDPPPAGSKQIRARLQAFVDEHGSEALHARLAESDPVSAGAIDHRNIRRVIRALEICELTGQPASTQKKKTPRPYHILKIGLIRPREELYARIDARIDDMLDQGLIAEVKALLKMGYEPSLPALSAIGYKQIVQALHDEMTMPEAVASIRKQTRQFVRRQRNWWKPDDPSIRWFRMTEGVEEEIIDLVREWLSKGHVSA